MHEMKNKTKKENLYNQISSAKYEPSCKLHVNMTFVTICLHRWS